MVKSIVAVFLLSDLILFGPIRVTFGQSCYQFSSSVPNVCKEKECPFGAECIPSFDGRSAECVCPEKCPLYGDSKGSRPVCGSDGHDYSNLCELNRQACDLEKEIYVRYNGSCGKIDHVCLAAVSVPIIALLRSMLWSQVSSLTDMPNRRQPKSDLQVQCGMRQRVRPGVWQQWNHLCQRVYSASGSLSKSSKFEDSTSRCLCRYVSVRAICVDIFVLTIPSHRRQRIMPASLSSAPSIKNAKSIDMASPPVSVLRCAAKC